MPGTKTLYVPNSVRDTSNGLYAVARGPESEVMREQSQIEKELYEISDKLEYYNRELYRIDPHLRVIMAKPNASSDGLKPGYYHLVRIRPGHGTYLETWEGPNGEWRDLDSGIFDLVAEHDLWNDRTQREVRQKQKRAREARDRQRAREAQDRADEFDSRLWHATHTSISVPRGV